MQTRIMLIAAATSALPAEFKLQIAVASTAVSGRASMIGIVSSRSDSSASQNQEYNSARPMVGRSTEAKVGPGRTPEVAQARSEEHTSELQSRQYLVCRLLL